MNGLSREQIMDNLLPFMKQVITTEQAKKAAEHINSLSDYDFEQLLAEIVYKAQQAGPVSAKRYAELVKEIKKLNGVNYKNSALNSYSIRFLSDEENRELLADIAKSKPSDHICLKGKDDDAICELWNNGQAAEVGGVPSDIFFAGNIPLLDCAITVDERDKDKVNGKICDFRVVIFEDYRERIEAAKGDSACVGAALFGDLVIPINVCEGIDGIMTGEVGWQRASKAQRENSKKYISLGDVSNMAYALLATWYGIQIALLHPTVKDVFRHPGREMVYDPDGGKGKKHKRITRYVRKHVINADEIRDAKRGTGREFTRHTLVWYVIGHWRHYDDGRKVFVKPYWKGALRELKRNLDDREREIVIGGACDA